MPERKILLVLFLILNCKVAVLTTYFIYKKKNQLEYISQKKEKKKRKYKNFSFEQDDLLLNTLRYDKEI